MRTPSTHVVLLALAPGLLAGCTAKSFPAHGSTAQASTPAPVGPDGVQGLELWLSAATLTLADGSPVSTWADSSAAGDTASQSSGSAQPTYHANGITGQPVVRFTSAAAASLTLAAPIGLQDYTVVAVGALTSNRLVYLGGDFDFFGPSSSSAAGPGSVLLRGAQDQGLTLASAAQTGAHIYTAVVSGWTGALYVDGAPLGSGPVPPTAFTQVGSRTEFNGQYSDGDVAEIAVYGAALSNDDRQSVEAYFKAKYFPGHPPCQPGNFQNWQPPSNANLPKGSVTFQGTETPVDSTDQPISITLAGPGLDTCLQVSQCEANVTDVSVNGESIISDGHDRFVADAYGGPAVAFPSNLTTTGGSFTDLDVEVQDIFSNTAFHLSMGFGDGNPSGFYRTSETDPGSTLNLSLPDSFCQ